MQIFQILKIEMYLNNTKCCSPVPTKYEFLLQLHQMLVNQCNICFLKVMWYVFSKAEISTVDGFWQFP